MQAVLDTAAHTHLPALDDACGSRPCRGMTPELAAMSARKLPTVLAPANVRPMGTEEEDDHVLLVRLSGGDGRGEEKSRREGKFHLNRGGISFIITSSTSAWIATSIDLQERRWRCTEKNQIQIPTPLYPPHIPLDGKG